jgi:hypothetical protein
MAKNTAPVPADLNNKGDAVFDPSKDYFPPFKQVLGVLGITHLDLNSRKVQVSVEGLLRLLSVILNRVKVDEEWYKERYVDVSASILSRDTDSAGAHFRLSGYLEGRLPCKLAFDPAYYFAQYSDLASTFAASDVNELRVHYETKGYFEGRAGVVDQFKAAEWWRAAASEAV